MSHATGYEPEFVKSPISTIEFDIFHRNGVDWIDAPLPPRFHRCVAQTVGYHLVDRVERCACGAARYGRSRRWIYKNERRS